MENDSNTFKGLALDVLFREIDLYTRSVDNLNSVAAIVVGFALAATAELLGFLLLVAAEYPVITAVAAKQPASTGNSPESFVGAGLTFVAIASAFAIFAFTPGPTGAGFRRFVTVSEDEFESARARIYGILDSQYKRLEKKQAAVRLGLSFSLFAGISWCIAIAKYMAQHFQH